MLRRGFVADLIGPGGNAIGLLRLSLALLVVVHHTRVLGGFGSDPVLRFARGQADLGVFAVAGFFTISGFLVTRSAERSSTARYLWHRALRVFPAFWVCLLVIALAALYALRPEREQSIVLTLTAGSREGTRSVLAEAMRTVPLSPGTIASM